MAGRGTCTGSFVNAAGVATPRVWTNFRSSFNHIGAAVITLMEVTSLRWIETARVAMDVRGLDLQPSREASPSNALFFIAFVYIGSFFTVNLFIGAGRQSMEGPRPHPRDVARRLTCLRVALPQA